MEAHLSDLVLAARPLSAPQYKFVSSPAKWIVYGGAAGGGKTHVLGIDPLRHCQGPTAVPEFRGCMFRRVYPDITKSGALLDFTKDLYSPFGAIYNHTSKEHRFPCGAKLALDSIQFEKNLDSFQGAQFDWVGMDEATQFPLKYIKYIWGRCRSKSGINTTLRMTCNPDNDSWLYRFLYWWISPETGLPIPERDGVIRHFILNEALDEFEWYDEPQYRMVVNNKTGVEKMRLVSTSATFIRACLEDNQALEEADPNYRINLESMPPAARERFLNGCWLASSAGDTEWPRECFLGVYCTESQFPIPEHREVVRMFAVDASKGKSQKKGDYSAIVCLAQTSDLKYVDADMRRRPPGEIVEDLFTFCENPIHRIRSGDLIGIESTQFQELFRNMIHLYAEKHPEYALSRYIASGNIIIPIEDKLNKMMRIRRLDRPIRNREFRFLQNPGTTLGLQQLKQFDGVPAVGKHDDFPDALDMAQQLPIHLENYYLRMREGKA